MKPDISDTAHKAACWSADLTFQASIQSFDSRHRSCFQTQSVKTAGIAVDVLSAVDFQLSSLLPSLVVHSGREYRAAIKFHFLQDFYTANATMRRSESARVVIKLHADETTCRSRETCKETVFGRSEFSNVE